MKKSILIVDDERAARFGMKLALEKDGYKVTEASDGIGAFDVIKSKNPSLIFLDINMPGKNGIDVLQDLKEEFDDLFVAMISGHNSFDNIRRSIELGADGFVSKPYTAMKIREMVDKFKSNRED